MHDLLLHVNDDEFDNQYRIRDSDEYFRLLIRSKEIQRFKMMKKKKRKILRSLMRLRLHVDLQLEFRVQDLRQHANLDEENE